MDDPDQFEEDAMDYQDDGMEFTLPPDVLLSIFKKLESNEMLQVRTVCREWLELIDEHKSLWRRLDLMSQEEIPPDQPFNKQLSEEMDWGGEDYDEDQDPDYVEEDETEDEELDEDYEDQSEEEDEEAEREVKKISVLELFDSKSGSSLQKVSMFIDLEERKAEHFIQLLEKNKNTLQFLHLLTLRTSWATIPESFSDLLWKLPNLVECVLMSSSNVKINWVEDKEKSASQPKSSSSLKLLWIPIGDSLFKSHLHLLDNLVSLKIGSHIEMHECRRLLEVPSQSLKHLDLVISFDGDYYTPPIIAKLELPKLEVFSLKVQGFMFFPTFMEVPVSLVLVLDKLLLSTPPIFTIWIQSLERLEFLEEDYPALARLIFSNSDPQKRVQFPSSVGDELCEILSVRNESVESGMEVNGIQMQEIDTVFIPLDLVDLEDLREVVEHVWDLKYFPQITVDLD